MIDLLASLKETGEVIMTLNSPHLFDVKAYRPSEGRIRSNIPRTVVIHVGTDFDFGSKALTPGCLEMSVNILAAFIPPGSDGLSTIACRKGQLSATASRLHAGFAEEYLMNAPAGELLIDRQVIIDYIQKGTAK